MLRDTASCQESHERFVKRVLTSEVVWCLSSGHGVADCDSNEEDSVVLMFWSDRAYASRVQQQAFPEYEVKEICLFDFLFRWLPGMVKDGVLAGTNWTGDLVGLELEPDALQDELLSALQPEQRMNFQKRMEVEKKK